MNQPIGLPTAASIAARSMNATGGLGQVDSGWTAATDNVGVARYNVHRGATSGLPPRPRTDLAANRPEHANTGLAAGTYYYRVTAEDAAGNVSAPGGGPRRGHLGHDRSDRADQSQCNRKPWAGRPKWGRPVTREESAVQPDRSTTKWFHALDGEQGRAADRLEPHRHGVGGRQLLLQADRRGRRRQPQRPLQPGQRHRHHAPVTGLVAAYGFDEGAGRNTVDKSGNSNTGTLSNTGWSERAGKLGNALPSTARTSGHRRRFQQPRPHDRAARRGVGAANALGNSYRTVAHKERPGSHAYVLYANGSGNDRAPIGSSIVGGYRERHRHRAAAIGYVDASRGHLQRQSVVLYVNGVQAAQLLVSGAITTSTSPL